MGLFRFQISSSSFGHHCAVKARTLVDTFPFQMWAIVMCDFVSGHNVNHYISKYM